MKKGLRGRRSRYSIVVPIYNSEQYLAECLDSVLAQDSSSNYEVILSDDGSTDRSGTICDEYAEKHENFCVLHHENGGLSYARNCGLAQATGEYVLFLDSDDVWESNLLSTLDGLLKDDPEIVLFGAELFGLDRDGFENLPALLPSGETGKEYLLRLLDADRRPLSYACAYAYRVDFLRENGLEFYVMPSSEDFNFNMRALPLAKSIAGTKAALYRYRQVADGLSHTLTAEKVLANLVDKARFYRLYPSGALANVYLGNVLLLPKLENRRSAQACIDFAEKNKDILQHATMRQLSIAKPLIRWFGFYRGAAIWQKIRWAKRKLLRESV